MENRIKQAIVDIVGTSNFTDSLIDLVSYSYDASDHEQRPDAAVWPAKTEDVSKILQVANTYHFPIIPRGAGTGLAGAVVPIHGGLILDMCRMNKILDIRIADRLVRVQPGVVYDDLQNALAPSGFCFPPDPASGSVCTLGGNVATNAGGIRGAKYGVTRDYVLSLVIVLPNGRILRTGTDCMKSSSGLDLTRLFVGSEGTLGVITEITLKIIPKPIASKTCQAFFADLQDAGQVVSDIMHSRIVPSVLEILEENAIQILRNHGGMKLPDARAMILVETDGYTKEEADFQMTEVINVLKKNRATRIQVAKSPREAEDLWRGRKALSSAAARLRPNNISEDVTVPISKVPDLLAGISRIARKHGLLFVIFGHAGDGNLHPKIMYDRNNPQQVQKISAAVGEIFHLTCNLGGTLTGEHGIGLAKAPFMLLEHSQTSLDLMSAIKNLVDPNNILNPGKMGLRTGAQ